MTKSSLYHIYLHRKDKRWQQHFSFTCIRWIRSSVTVLIQHNFISIYTFTTISCFIFNDRLMLMSSASCRQGRGWRKLKYWFHSSLTGCQILAWNFNKGSNPSRYFLLKNNSLLHEKRHVFTELLHIALVICRAELFKMFSILKNGSFDVLK